MKALRKALQKRFLRMHRVCQVEKRVWSFFREKPMEINEQGPNQDPGAIGVAH